MAEASGINDTHYRWYYHISDQYETEKEGRGILDQVGFNFTNIPMEIQNCMPPPKIEDNIIKSRSGKMPKNKGNINIFECPIELTLGKNTYYDFNKNPIMISQDSVSSPYQFSYNKVCNEHKYEHNEIEEYNYITKEFGYSSRPPTPEIMTDSCCHKFIDPEDSRDISINDFYGYCNYSFNNTRSIGFGVIKNIDDDRYSISNGLVAIIQCHFRKNEQVNFYDDYDYDSDEEFEDIHIKKCCVLLNIIIDGKREKLMFQYNFGCGFYQYYRNEWYERGKIITQKLYDKIEWKEGHTVE